MQGQARLSQGLQLLGEPESTFHSVILMPCWLMTSSLGVCGISSDDGAGPQHAAWSGDR